MAVPVRIEAEGHVLAGHYHPPAGRAIAALVLHGATGVPQRFYRAFARWCSERGVGVLTYDYRDFGASAGGALQASRTTMADWLVRDQAAAERTLAELVPEGPLWLLGHSIGGLGFPFREPHPRVKRMIAVGAGFGHVGDHPWSYRPTALAFWYGPGPVATALAGYLPGRRLLLGVDLPAGVYWQWRRWCTRRGFYAGDFGRTLPMPNFKASGPPLRIATMEDDVVVPPQAVWRYADAHAPDRVERLLLRPRDFGLASLGHIPILAERSRAAWPALLGLAAETGTE